MVPLSGRQGKELLNGLDWATLADEVPEGRMGGEEMRRCLFCGTEEL